MDYQTLLDRIRAGYDSSSNSSDQEAYRMALEAKCCCSTIWARTASPIGWRIPSPRSSPHRCNNRKPLIATTNLPDPDAGSRTTQKTAAGQLEYLHTLASTSATRARSRLFEMCTVIRMPTTARTTGSERQRRFEARSPHLLLMRLSRALPACAQPTTCRRSSFPYYLYPRTLWERELVWLKNIGVRTVEFSIPAELAPVAARRIRFHAAAPARAAIWWASSDLLRKLGLRAWVRPAAGPVPGWLDGASWTPRSNAPG